jgi:hypothetical protein
MAVLLKQLSLLENRSGHNLQLICGGPLGSRRSRRDVCAHTTAARTISSPPTSIDRMA